jgi:hypothetical protein
MCFSQHGQDIKEIHITKCLYLLLMADIQLAFVMFPATQITAFWI